jgi:hypothetical protein
MIPESILFVVVLSMLFTFVENKSNFPSYIMIPIIVGAITKYVLGDWDEGYMWTKMDPPYWACLFGFSALTVLVVNKAKLKMKWN